MKEKIRCSAVCLNSLPCDRVAVIGDLCLIHFHCVSGGLPKSIPLKERRAGMDLRGCKDQEGTK